MLNILYKILNNKIEQNLYQTFDINLELKVIELWLGTRGINLRNLFL